MRNQMYLQQFYNYMILDAYVNERKIVLEKTDV